MNIDKTAQAIKDTKEKVLPHETEAKILRAIEENRNRIDKKFPLGTAIATTVGLVMVLYGTEKIIDKTFFAEHPWMLVFSGLIVLAVTGSIYRKL